MHYCCRDSRSYLRPTLMRMFYVLIKSDHSWQQNKAITSAAFLGNLTKNDFEKMCKHGQLQKAFWFLRYLGNDDHFIFAWFIRGCRDCKDIVRGKQVHGWIIKHGLDEDLLLYNLLICMYGKCSCLGDAVLLFDIIPTHNLVSWNALLSAYAQDGDGRKALKILRVMSQKGIAPDRVTFIACLEACGRPDTLEEAILVHSYIIGYALDSDLVVGNALLTMYGKCGRLESAKNVFDQMTSRDVVSWTGMIGAYVDNGNEAKALQLFRQMHSHGIKPNRVTYLTVFGVCQGPRALTEGKMAHACMIKQGHGPDHTVQNALVNMYGKCCSMDDAWKIFCEMSQLNVITWTTMMASCNHVGRSKDALHLFHQMITQGRKPNLITYITTLNACVTPAALAEGKFIHAYVNYTGFEHIVALGNALMLMYTRCRSLDDACNTFDRLHYMDITSWNAIITAYTQHQCGIYALKLYEQMSLDNMKPDIQTFISIIDACAILAALEEGSKIHCLVQQCGYELDTLVGTALIDMYGKSGCLQDAYEIFTHMPERDVIAWTAMIAVYAHGGHGNDSVQLFEQMHQEGIRPNKITFLNMLYACSHAGFVNEGFEYLFLMTTSHKFIPDLEHYGCIIDLLGRTGWLSEAQDVIDRLPLDPGVMTWMSFLNASRIHYELE